MECVVVGGAGFIGSNLVKFLLQSTSYSSVTVVDNFSSGKMAHLTEFTGDRRFSVFQVDALQTSILAKVFSGKEVVFLLASNPDIQKAVTQPRIDFDQGTKIVESVVEACRLSSVQFLVFASGSGVYGERGSAVLDEDSALDPISTYGASKIAGEKLLIAYAHMFGIKARIYRFANVVGPNQTHGVVYDFVSKLKKDPTRLEILGDGNQIKSYIHVSDVINAIDTTFLLNDKLYEIYNVSTNELVTVNMIAEMCIHKLEIQK
jgi:UDP-glucose 4-epimerase